MSAAPTPFEPGAALARVAVTPTGYQIDTRGPYGARHYDFTSVGEAAEFAIILHHDGSWPLRFGAGTDEVKAVIDELTGIGL